MYIFEIQCEGYPFDFLMEGANFYVLFPVNHYKLDNHSIQSEIELIHNKMIYKRKIETQIRENLFDASLQQYVDQAMAQQMVDDYGVNLSLLIRFKISSIKNPSQINFDEGQFIWVKVYYDSYTEEEKKTLRTGQQMEQKQYKFDIIKKCRYNQSGFHSNSFAIQPSGPGFQEKITISFKAPSEGIILKPNIITFRPGIQDSVLVVAESQQGVRLNSLQMDILILKGVKENFIDLYVLMKYEYPFEDNIHINYQYDRSECYPQVSSQPKKIYLNQRNWSLPIKLSYSLPLTEDMEFDNPFSINPKFKTIFKTKPKKIKIKKGQTQTYIFLKANKEFVNSEINYNIRLNKSIIKKIDNYQFGINLQRLESLIKGSSNLQKFSKTINQEADFDEIEKEIAKLKDFVDKNSKQKDFYMNDFSIYNYAMILQQEKPIRLEIQEFVIDQKILIEQSDNNKKEQIINLKKLKNPKNKYLLYKQVKQAEFPLKDRLKIIGNQNFMFCLVLIPFWSQKLYFNNKDIYDIGQYCFNDKNIQKQQTVKVFQRSGIYIIRQYNDYIQKENHYQQTIFLKQFLKVNYSYKCFVFFQNQNRQKYLFRYYLTVNHNSNKQKPLIGLIKIDGDPLKYIFQFRQRIRYPYLVVILEKCTQENKYGLVPIKSQKIIFTSNQTCVCLFYISDDNSFIFQSLLEKDYMGKLNKSFIYIGSRNINYKIQQIQTLSQSIQFKINFPFEWLDQYKWFSWTIYIHVLNLNHRPIQMKMISRARKQNYINYCEYKVFKKTLYLYKKTKCKKYQINIKNTEQSIKKYIKGLKVNQIYKISFQSQIIMFQ